MTSGHGVMQRQRHHLPLGPGLWFVKIDKEGTGARAIRRSFTVIRGGRVRGYRCGNLFHSVWLPGKGAEHLDQVGINGLRNDFVSVKQLLRGFVKELRIASQELKEFL